MGMSDLSLLPMSISHSQHTGVLKGSEQAFLCEDGYLDKDSYIALSHRTHPTFASCREDLYQLFLVYLKRKRERREYDAPDRFATSRTLIV